MQKPKRKNKKSTLIKGFTVYAVFMDYLENYVNYTFNRNYACSDLLINYEIVQFF